MKRWHLVAVGRLKQPDFKQAVTRYEERLSPWCRIDTVELKDQGREVEATRQLEWIARCPVGGIVLTEHGQTYDSQQFARLIESLPSGSVWLLGGADGFTDHVRVSARHQVSLSPLTFPHDLARVILYEQWYRAHTLLAGHPYHRAG